MRIAKMGPLTVRLTGGTDGQGGGNGPLVVLMHGFGAPGTDLVGLGQVLSGPAGLRFAFPEAPLALNMPMIDARAWWMIDVERIQRAMMTGQLRDVRNEQPPGLEQARSAVIEMLDALEAGLGPSGVVLGGFSQGAILTVDVALHTNRPFAGLLLFSGTFMSADAWKPRMAARAGLRVLQSHGMMDPILPYPLAQELHEALKEAGLDAQFVGFPGAHEIGGSTVAQASRFLSEVL